MTHSSRTLPLLPAAAALPIAVGAQPSTTTRR